MIRARPDRGRNVYQVVVYAGTDPITGKERRIRRTVRGTKTEARTLERRLLLEVADGARTGTDLAVADLLAAWLDHVGPDLAATTTREYRRLIEKTIGPELGKTRVSKLTPARIDRFYGALRRDGLAPKSIRNIHALLGSALHQAVKWGWVPTNPATNATPPRAVASEIHPPDADAVVRLLKRALDEDPDYGTFLWLAATTGARRGELAALQWRDVDLEAETLLIERAIAVVDGDLIVKDTKTHQARRIALGAPTIAVLDRHRSRALERAEIGGYYIEADSWVFHAPSGAPWHPDTLTSRYRRLADLEGIAARLHDLRHFVATQALAAGVPVRTVSGRLGHRNAATTHNVYAHFVEASDRVLAEALDDLLGATPGTR